MKQQPFYGHGGFKGYGKGKAWSAIGFTIHFG
jgi:hypothetical protein